MPTWTYKGRLVNEISDMPEGTYGFIYQTTHKASGKKYIGKKVLFFERNKRLGKRALEALREERKAKGLRGRVPLKQKVITESDCKRRNGIITHWHGVPSLLSMATESYSALLRTMARY